MKLPQQAVRLRPNPCHIRTSHQMARKRRPEAYTYATKQAAYCVLLMFLIIFIAVMIIVLDYFQPQGSGLHFFK